MSNNPDFWHNPDDEEVLFQYLREHSYDISFDAENEELRIGVGSNEEPTEFCAICNTPITLIPTVGYKHLYSLKDRDECITPWPC